MTTAPTRDHRRDDRRAGPKPSVLVLTSYRPSETELTVDGLELETYLLTIDAGPGPVGRAVGTARRVSEAIRRHDPDLLLLDVYETIGAPATWVASQNDVPVVARLVGDTWRILAEERIGPARERRDPVSYAVHRTSHALNRYIFRRAVGFVAVSSALSQVIARRTGCPPTRIGVVPTPLSVESWRTGSADAAREMVGVTTDRVLLTVTNLKFKAKLDGVQRIISEVRSLLQADPELSYVVAGGGQHHATLRKSLDERIDDPGVRNRIHAPGHVDAVQDLYALADVFAYVSDLDGYPNVVLEAQAAGLPVVANDAHGMRDQITDGESGFLVDIDAEGELRDRVALLFEDPTARRRIGDGARRRVERDNDPEEVADRLESFLTELYSDLSLQRQRQNA